ncbi:MAG: helix-turn-helix domain-containing protein [Treponema sp.]|jgi:predicted XRE-type DNA-binding protein|nr:helix-turn-helix domain-containing protein [Treponema sp.]
MKGIGQNFDEFLKEQDIFDEVNELAAKKIITYQLKQAMQEQNLTKSAIAKKMKTSRVAIDNILDPAFNTSIDSLERFAYVLGKKLTISLS